MIITKNPTPAKSWSRV